MRSPIAAGIFVLLFAMPSLAGPPPLRAKHSPITDADRAFWSFRPVAHVTVPKAVDDAWCRNPIDAFILSSLREHQLAPSKQADRVTLIRRATFDLHGLPPTPAEVDAFVNDPSSDAYEKLIDRLLASPRYGERMARQWLDLVRYAESDGFKQDAYRPNAWRYRDYVIRSFNEDKAYDRFVTEQLAGDEIAPDDPDVIVATGYLRHWPYEYNQRDVPKQWADILSDVTDVTGDALLGLSVGCAKCHDHKFDPILQSDYYRLEAFFTPMLPRDDVPLTSQSERAEFAKQQAAWEQKTAVLRAEIAAIEAPFIRRTAEIALSKFPPETQAILAAPPAGRTPLEQQWAWLAYRQVYDPDENPPVKIEGKKDPKLKERYESLKKQLAAMDAERPKPLAKGQVVGDVGPVAPPTFVLGDRSHPLEPGTPVVLGETVCKLQPIVPTASSTGRRTALAKWITDPANPLTARVMVNRVWQSHFDRGLVGTSSDFGHLGERPSHPELLDWLAGGFVSRGWSLKQMHRLIMTSAAYRQASEGSRSAQVALTSDPDNRLVWRMSPRRLDAEQVRDTMLATSGELSCDAGGPPIDSKLPRRSIYTKATRNTRDRLLDAFDAPESFCSVASRNCTTTPSQSLMLLNGEWPLKRAEAFAAHVRQQANTSDPSAQVNLAYRLAYGRTPSAEERARAASFVTRESGDAGLVDLCHVLLSSNEFLYVD